MLLLVFWPWLQPLGTKPPSRCPLVSEVSHRVAGRAPLLLADPPRHLPRPHGAGHLARVSRGRASESFRKIKSFCLELAGERAGPLGSHGPRSREQPPVPIPAEFSATLSNPARLAWPEGGESELKGRWPPQPACQWTVPIPPHSPSSLTAPPLEEGQRPQAPWPQRPLELR